MSLTQSRSTKGAEAGERRKSVAEELGENLEGEIRNPLKSLAREQLIEDVIKFQQEKGLPEDILPGLAADRCDLHRLEGTCSGPICDDCGVQAPCRSVAVRCSQSLVVGD